MHRGEERTEEEGMKEGREGNDGPKVMHRGEERTEEEEMNWKLGLGRLGSVAGRLCSHLTMPSSAAVSTALPHPDRDFIPGTNIPFSSSDGGTRTGFCIRGGCRALATWQRIVRGGSAQWDPAFGARCYGLCDMLTGLERSAMNSSRCSLDQSARLSSGRENASFASSPSVTPSAIAAVSADLGRSRDGKLSRRRLSRLEGAPRFREDLFSDSPSSCDLAGTMNACKEEDICWCTGQGGGRSDLSMASTSFYGAAELPVLS